MDTDEMKVFLSESKAFNNIVFYQYVTVTSN